MAKSGNDNIVFRDGATQLEVIRDLKNVLVEDQEMSEGHRLLIEQEIVRANRSPIFSTMKVVRSGLKEAFYTWIAPKVSD